MNKSQFIIQCQNTVITFSLVTWIGQQRRGVTPLYHGSNISGSQQWGTLATTTARDGNENGKKSNRFVLAKQQLCTCITLFGTFLNNDLKLPNFTRRLYGVGEHNTRIFFFFY